MISLDAVRAAQLDPEYEAAILAASRGARRAAQLLATRSGLPPLACARVVGKAIGVALERFLSAPPDPSTP